MRQPMRIIGAVALGLALFLAMVGLLVFVLTSFLGAVSEPSSSGESGGVTGGDISVQFDGESTAADASSSEMSAQKAEELAKIDTAEPQAAIERSLERAAQALAAPQNQVDASDAMAQNALVDLQATIDEWEVLGYRQEGQAKVTQLRVLAHDPATKTMRVMACVDSSETRVIDESGREVSNEDAPARSQIIYDLLDVDGQWKVTHLTFPEDPEC